MAQHWLEITSGYDPSGWTAVLGPAGTPSRDLTVVDDGGTAALRYGNASSGRVLYIPDFVTDSENVEIFIRGRTVPGAGTSFLSGVGARLSSTQIDGYFAAFRVGGRLIAERYINDSGTQLAVSGIGDGVSDEEAYHWMGVSAQGSSIDFYSWDGVATDRPATARLSITDANLSGARPVGLASNGDLIYGYVTHIAIGTDGDPAPTGPVGGTIPTLSAPGVTDIGSTSVRPQVTLTY